MPTRPKKHRKSSAESRKLSVSRTQVLEFCRRPSTWILFGCLGLASALTAWGFQSGSNSVADTDLSDEQLESDFLALGALGVSDSASSNSSSVNSKFNFGKNANDVEPPIFNVESAFMNRTTAPSTPEFEPSFYSDGPRFGRPITTTDSQSESAIRQTGFEQAEPSYAAASSARVTANQAVWLTGNIETR